MSSYLFEIHRDVNDGPVLWSIHYNSKLEMVVEKYKAEDIFVDDDAEAVKSINSLIGKAGKSEFERLQTNLRVFNSWVSQCYIERLIDRVDYLMVAKVMLDNYLKTREEKRGRFEQITFKKLIYFKSLRAARMAILDDLFPFIVDIYCKKHKRNNIDKFRISTNTDKVCVTHDYECLIEDIYDELESLYWDAITQNCELHTCGGDRCGCYTDDDGRVRPLTNKVEHYYDELDKTIEIFKGIINDIDNNNSERLMNI